ncbi:antirestriction protein ArdA [Fodinicola acaciae]|uniref:antirestriction protein ArdA n=1 Tax=Fodinicola acaciae TaxID=2681555 RepID=UPI0013D652CE|nr:antirestriction protein ArdA [Fodinicola acaciae]
MEQHPFRPFEAEPSRNPFTGYDPQLEPPYLDDPFDSHIREGVTSAEAEHRLIDDTTAAVIAFMYHDGLDSAFLRLARTGEVDAERLAAEIAAANAEDIDYEGAMDALAAYCADRAAAGETAAVLGWAERASEELSRRHAIWDVAEAERNRDWLIADGMAAAEAASCDIDHLTAREIARRLMRGSDGPLAALAATGVVDAHGVMQELDALVNADSGFDLEILFLGSYVNSRAEAGETAAVPGWTELTNHAPRRQPAAADIDTTTLRASTTESDHNLNEPDPFHWADAATWHTDDQQNSELDEAEVYAARLQALFELADHVDAELGDRTSLDDLWAGRCPYQDGRPGGIVMLRTPYADVRVFETDSDEALQAEWETLEREHEAYESAVAGAGLGQRSPNEPLEPTIWVASLADYTNGHLHGAWFDATLSAEELQDAANFLLRGSRTLGAEEPAIFDYSDFGRLGLDDDLGEHPSFATVSKLANGLREHGEAYAAYVAVVGLHNPNDLDTFADAYEGAYDSMHAWAEAHVAAMDDSNFQQYIPDWLAEHVHIDYEGLAEERSHYLDVVDRPGGGIYVFRTDV